MAPWWPQLLDLLMVFLDMTSTLEQGATMGYPIPALSWKSQVNPGPFLLWPTVPTYWVKPSKMVQSGQAAPGLQTGTTCDSRNDTLGRL